MTVICIRAKEEQGVQYHNLKWEQHTDREWSGIDSAEEDEDFEVNIWNTNDEYTYDFVGKDFFEKFKTPYR